MFCFVILHYIAVKETIKCVQSITNCIQFPKKIIIVDNHSPNNSGCMLKEKYHDNGDVIVIINDQNLGYARGNNIGFQYAKEHFNPLFIVILNNDVEIQDKLFDKKVQEIYNKEYFYVLGPDVYSTSSEVHQSPKCLYHYTLDRVEKLNMKYRKSFQFRFTLYVKCIFKQNFWLRKKIYKRRRSKIDHKKTYFNVPLHGACLIFSDQYIAKFNQAFLESTFFYFESEILDYKCHINNLKTMYCPEIKVLHHQNIATNKAYSDLFAKTVFSYRCNIESSQAFINYIKECKELEKE